MSRLQRTPRRPWFLAWRWPVLLAAAVVVALSVLASGGAQNMTEGGYADPGADSSRAERVLNEKYGTGSVNFVLVAWADQEIRIPQVAAAGRRLAARLAAEEGVVDVRSPWTSEITGLASGDRRTALLTMRVTGDDTTADRTARRLIDDYSGSRAPLHVQATGRLAVNCFAEEQGQRDLVHSEVIAVPLVSVLLVWFFGSFWACLLPLVIGLIVIMGARAMLGTLAQFTTVSAFSLNLITALGFGLAVDFSLITVSRFREELGHGKPLVQAVAATVRSAGRAVVVSASVAGLSLSTLLLFPVPFFRSLGAAALAVVVLAGATATVLQPVLLAALGHRMARRPHPSDGGTGRFWDGLARAVLRRRLPVALGTSAVLLLLAVPFTTARCGFVDDHWLPRGAAPRTVAEQARREFPAMRGSVLNVLLPADRKSVV